MHVIPLYINSIMRSGVVFLHSVPGNSFSVIADSFFILSLSCNSFLFCRFVFMVSEQAADPASVQLAELQNVFQQAL